MNIGGVNTRVDPSGRPGNENLGPCQLLEGRSSTFTRTPGEVWVTPGSSSGLPDMSGCTGGLRRLC